MYTKGFPGYMYVKQHTKIATGVHEALKHNSTSYQLFESSNYMYVPITSDQSIKLMNSKDIVNGKKKLKH